MLQWIEAPAEQWQNSSGGEEPVNLGCWMFSGTCNGCSEGRTCIRGEGNGKDRGVRDELKGGSSVLEIRLPRTVRRSCGLAENR